MCARHRVPVIAYGAGTSIEGHIMAVEGGVTIDLSRMNKIVAVNAEDLTATVEADFEVMPGEKRQVTFALKKHGDRWQIDDVTGAGGSMRKWLADGIKGAGK